jgi:flagellar hook assembly protein FlgD
VKDQDGWPAALPATALLQNFPNPFNGQTAISLTVAAPTAVKLAIFDVLGRRMATLIDGSLAPGIHTVSWDGRDRDGRPASTGIYLARLDQGGGRTTEKLLLLR